MSEILDRAKKALKEIRHRGDDRPDKAPTPEAAPSPQSEADPFKRAFHFLYDRLTGPGRTWESCPLAAEIRAALERMDSCWVKRDLTGFMLALADVHRLLTAAGFER